MASGTGIGGKTHRAPSAADKIALSPDGFTTAQEIADLGTALTTVADAAFAAGATDRAIGYTSITAARIITLPLSADCNPGQILIVKDISGSADGTKTITVARQGADLIDGATSHVAVNDAHGSRTYMAAGAGKWCVIA